MTPDSNTLPYTCPAHPDGERAHQTLRTVTGYPCGDRYYCAVCGNELAPPAQESGTAQCRHQP